MVGNVATDRNEIVSEGMDGTEEGPIGSSCKHSNESSVFVEGWEYFDQEFDYHLLKLDCDP
jgi:hypothetical protein